MGVYEVTEEEIANLAFDGPCAPAHPRFPITEGLSGASVASRQTVVVGDVTNEPRYLTAFGSTRSEMIVPVLGGARPIRSRRDRPRLSVLAVGKKIKRKLAMEKESSGEASVVQGYARIVTSRP